MEQISMRVGGATPDESHVAFQVKGEVKEVGWSASKGDDVELTVKGRVVDVQFKDVYDAHGNVSKTIRKHVIRVDEMPEGGAVMHGKAWTAAPQEPEPGDVPIPGQTDILGDAVETDGAGEPVQNGSDPERVPQEA